MSILSSLTSSLPPSYDGGGFTPTVLLTPTAPSVANSSLTAPTTGNASQPSSSSLDVSRDFSPPPPPSLLGQAGGPMMMPPRTNSVSVGGGTTTMPPSSAGGEDNLEIDLALHELMDSEVFIDLQRLRDLCRNGIPAEFRQPVWKYLLHVSISPDKSQEETHAKRQQEMYALFHKTRVGSNNAVSGAGGSGGVGVSGTAGGAAGGPRGVGPMFMGGALRSIGGGLGLVGLGVGEDRISRLMQQIKLFNPQIYGNPAVRSKVCPVERVLQLYLAIHMPEHEFVLSALPYLVCPFTLMDREEDLYYSFHAFMALNCSLFTVVGLRQMVGTCLMLFAHLLPDLYAHFNDEAVESNQWLLEWLSTLLSKQLALENVLRLWDTYLVGSSEDGFSLHVYVCLALLQQYRERLLDMDGPEILRFLQRLPKTNISIVCDLVIRAAYNIREDVRARELLYAH